MSGEAGEELDTPAARIMARRESRAAMPDRLKVAAPDDSSDEEWNGDDDEDEEEDGRVYLDASKCGRVRLHAVQGPERKGKETGREENLVRLAASPDRSCALHFTLSCLAPHHPWRPESARRPTQVPWAHLRECGCTTPPIVAP